MGGKGEIKQKVFASVMTLALFLLPFSGITLSSQNQAIPRARAATTSQKLNAVNTQITLDGQQITVQKTQVAYLQQQVQQLNAQIAAVQKALQTTQNNINGTQSKIAQLAAQIKDQQAKYDQQKQSLGSLVADWYMQGGDPGLAMTIIGSNSLSDMITMGQYYASVKDQIETTIQKINDLKKQLADQKTAQDQQLSSLTSLKNDQSSQQRSLSGNQSTKQNLISSTQSTINQLQQDQQTNLKLKSQYEADLASEQSQTGYGNDIIASNDSSWYYTQLGNSDTLGYSDATINDYGCLITSIAMIATYYGPRVTPNNIADDPSNFDGEGDLIVSTPPEVGDSITVGSSVTSNPLGTITREVQAGRPVIAGIRFPSISRHNNDGSNHYIVIKGLRSDGKYIMQDPINRTGYPIGWVVAAKVVTPH